jgi:hypothetical protein
MAALVYIFGTLAGMQLTCDQLEAAAATYACLPRATQLPALIYLASQIIANGGTGGGGATQVFSGNYGGYPNLPPFSPTVSAAIAIDTVDGNQTQWYNGSWH